MACRDVNKAEDARNWVVQQSAGKEGLGRLSIYHLDLSSLNSVRTCAKKIHDEESHIHILINNAGSNFYTFASVVFANLILN